MRTDLLVFRIKRELFATQLRAVEEAVDLTEVRELPAAATTVRGVFTLRGVLVPLFSPAAALGVAPDEAATALIVRDAAGLVAIVVDDVEDVLGIADADLRPLPPAHGRDAGVVRGLVRRGGELVAVVDLDALIAACRGAKQPEAA